MSKQSSQAREYAETLSALMDGEAEELELRRLLKDIPEHPELADTWNRYNLARSVLHKEEVFTVSEAGSQRILAALAAEAPLSSGKASARRSAVTWLPAVGRFAIAASVTLAVFVGLQSALDQGGPADMVAGTVDEQSAASVEQPRAAVEIAAETEFDAEAQQRLNDYIRGVSIQFRENEPTSPGFNILQDSQLIRQVNQIEN